MSIEDTQKKYLERLKKRKSKGSANEKKRKAWYIWKTIPKF